jgi:hypothetical protein
VSYDFGYDVDQHGHGRIITNRPAQYRVELLQNGFARVDHHHGAVDLVEPDTGRVRSGGGNLPAGLIAEIQKRWGRR